MRCGRDGGAARQEAAMEGQGGWWWAITLGNPAAAATHPRPPTFPPTIKPPYFPAPGPFYRRPSPPTAAHGLGVQEHVWCTWWVGVWVAGKADTWDGSDGSRRHGAQGRNRIDSIIHFYNFLPNPPHTPRTSTHRFQAGGSSHGGFPRKKRNGRKLRKKEPGPWKRAMLHSDRAPTKVTANG